MSSPLTCLNVGVVGGTGYTGAEIARLLEKHPRAKLVRATSERQAGRRLDEACPWLDSPVVLEKYAPEMAEGLDVLFFCTENGFAMRHVPDLLPVVRIVDLSADFRLKQPGLYPEWYKLDHSCPGLLESAVWSIPELTDVQRLVSTRLVANPGCYVTASVLALRPLIDAGLVEGVPIIDAKSGLSGAGRSKMDTDYLFSELFGNFKAYGAAAHRHTPEIEQGLGGRQVRFVPHLIPSSRGILATIHFRLRSGAARGDVLTAWNERYAGRRFVRVMEVGTPSTKLVQGSNRCILGAEVDQRTGMAVAVSAIDNLVRGASGQAIQNMNLMFGLPEEDGLSACGVWP